MLAFILQRVLQGLVVLLVVASVSFVLFRFAGDPVSQLVNEQVPAEQRAQIRAQLGLDDPAPVQYVRFVGRALRGEFGVSYRMSRPVVDVIRDRLPATLELALVSVIFALALGVPMGVYAALRPDSVLSAQMQGLSLLGVSLPSFFIAIILILVFSVELPLLPSFGRGQVVDLGGWTTGLLTVSGLKALVLPTVTLGLFQLTLIMRLVRGEMLEVLRADYIRFARARGLRDRTVYFGHALRATLVPVITITGLQFGHIVAFAIITESVFQWPGMGLLFLQALQFVDIPLMSTYLLLIALIFVCVNLIVDLLYFAVDPRLRISDVAAARHAG